MIKNVFLAGFADELFVKKAESATQKKMRKYRESSMRPQKLKPVGFFASAKEKADQAQRATAADYDRRMRAAKPSPSPRLSRVQSKPSEPKKMSPRPRNWVEARGMGPGPRSRSPLSNVQSSASEPKKMTGPKRPSNYVEDPSRGRGPVRDKPAAKPVAKKPAGKSPWESAASSAGAAGAAGIGGFAGKAARGMAAGISAAAGGAKGKAGDKPKYERKITMGKATIEQARPKRRRSRKATAKAVSMAAGGVKKKQSRGVKAYDTFVDDYVSKLPKKGAGFKPIDPYKSAKKPVAQPAFGRKVGFGSAGKLKAPKMPSVGAAPKPPQVAARSTGAPGPRSGRMAPMPNFGTGGGKR